MKSLSLVVVLLAALTMQGCGEDLRACGNTYHTVGLFDEEDRVPGVQYKTIGGNVFWGVVLFSTFLVAPLYFFGYSLFEPVSANCDKVPR